MYASAILLSNPLNSREPHIVRSVILCALAQSNDAFSDCPFRTFLSIKTVASRQRKYKLLSVAKTIHAPRIAEFPSPGYETPKSPCHGSLPQLRLTIVTDLSLSTLSL